MGFFENVLPAQTGLRPITQERLKESLERLELTYEQDPAGELTVFLPLGSLNLLLARQLGLDVLSLRGSWRGTLPLDFLSTAQELTNYWNQNRPFLKAFPYRWEEGGQVSLIMPVDMSVPYAGGATDEQLDEHIGTALQLAQEYFSLLTETFSEEK